MRRAGCTDHIEGVPPAVTRKEAEISDNVQLQSPQLEMMACRGLRPVVESAKV